MIGESAVDKSGLVLRFYHGDDDRKRDTQATVGGGFVVATNTPTRVVIAAAFVTKTIVARDHVHTLEIWDTAGQVRRFERPVLSLRIQERYRSLAPMYYRGARAALVVYDITVRSSFVKAHSWIEELERSDQVAPNIVLALAGNMHELEDKREVNMEEARAYAEEHGAYFVETSAKTGLNVHALFRDIAATVQLRTPAGLADSNKSLTSINPAIHQAAALGELNKVQDELDMGVDVNLRSPDADAVPLLFAAHYGRLEIVHELIKCKAIVNLADAEGGAPLFRACARGHLTVARVLLDARADINATTRPAKETPLMGAARSGHADVVQLLLERGSDVSIENQDGDTVWIVARENKQVASRFVLHFAPQPKRSKDVQRLLRAIDFCLDFSRCQLKTVPDWVAHITDLKELDLEHNQITHLPAWLGGLPFLRRLEAAGNPLVGEQLIALNKETGFLKQKGALLAYLQTSAQRVPQRHLLLTVLGHFMVGKTAVLNALAGAKKAPKPEERTVQVTTDVLEDKQSGIIFGVRELPGQTQFYGGNRRFLSLRTTVLVVVVRLTDESHHEEEEQLRLWLSLLSNHVQRGAKEERLNVRTVLVATHLDQYLKRYPTGRQRLDHWALPLTLRLQTDYPEVGVQSTGLVLVNAMNQHDTRKAVMSEIRSLARGLLHERTIPKFMIDVHELWQRGKARLALWMDYEQSIQALLSELEAVATKRNQKDLVQNRGIAEFALSVLVDMGDVIRLGRNIVICNPSWLSRVIASLVLPPEKPFEGLPEGKGAHCMENGVASAETLCSYLVKRGLVAANDRKELPNEGLKLLDWLEALDILFPLPSPNGLPRLSLVPARLNNAHLAAPTFERKHHVIARRLVLPATERFAPGFIAHLACHLWHLDIVVSPSLFAQLEMKLLMANSCTLLSLNRAHSELTAVIWGSTAALAVDAPVVLEAVQDGLCLLRGGRSEGMQWLKLCSNCVRGGLDKAHVVCAGNINAENGTFLCETEGKLNDLESLDLPASAPAPAAAPDNIAAWCVHCVHWFILERKPHYADTLRRQGQALDGRAMLALQSADDVFNHHGVELQKRCDEIFKMAQQLQAAFHEWKEQRVEQHVLNRLVGNGVNELKREFTAQHLELRAMLEHVVRLQADAQTTELDSALALADKLHRNASPSSAAVASAVDRARLKEAILHLLSAQRAAGQANVDALMDAVLATTSATPAGPAPAPFDKGDRKNC